MKKLHLRLLLVAAIVAVSLFSAQAVYAGTPSRSVNISGTLSNTVDSIASQFGFSSSSLVSRTSGGYKYNSGHQGMNAQYKGADGSLLTIDYCQNGAYVATILTPCISSSANICGMLGSGFVTKVVSNEQQVHNSTSACSAQKPSDSLCSSGQSSGNAASGGNSNSNTCVATNICSSIGNVINSCTSALVQVCKAGCTDGKCNGECSPHYFCKNDNLYYGDTAYSYCSASLSQICQWGCSNNACNPKPTTQFGTSTFSGDGGAQFSTNGSLVAQPAIVQKGNTTTLYWNVLHVKPGSCKVVGSNNDTFSGTDTGSAQDKSNSSGTNGIKTSAITGQTSYTLTCTEVDNSKFSATTIVNTIPTFQEQ